MLEEFGLPEGQFLPALIGFNIGVELGQLTVIALAFAVVGLAMRRVWYRSRSRFAVPVSCVIAAVGPIGLCSGCFCDPAARTPVQRAGQRQTAQQVGALAGRGASRVRWNVLGVQKVPRMTVAAAPSRGLALPGLVSIPSARRCHRRNQRPKRLTWIILPPNLIADAKEIGVGRKRTHHANVQRAFCHHRHFDHL